MQISKRTLLIVGEATATTAIGLIHAGAGVALTFGLAFWHIRYDNTMPVQQYRVEQRVRHSVSIAQGVGEKQQESENAE
jgi:hypothetical protein